MDKNIIEFKERLIATGLFKRVSASQYRVRECPKCGDRKWHCYVKIDINTDEPVFYHCFKCNSSGVVDKSFVDYLNIDLRIPNWKYRKNISTNTSVMAIEKTEMDSILSKEDDVSGISQYINSRIGVIPSYTDLEFFNFIGNPLRYGTAVLDGDISYLDKRYWFKLTNGNMLGRYEDDSVDMRWLRFKSKRIKMSGIYKINLPFDLYQNINVIIAEGIMDVIGLYYHYKSLSNNIYIATLGKSYQKGIEFVLQRGIFGPTVNIHIFKDSDVPVEKIWIPKEYNSLFKRINIYENQAFKDYGTKSENFDIHKIIK